MMRLRHASPVLLVLAAVLVLSACSESQPDLDSAPTAADLDLVVYQGAEVLGGNEVTLSDVLEQGKPVVLNMWAGLCPVCRLEMPEVQTIYEEYGDRVTVIGVDVGTLVQLGTEADARAMLDELRISFPAGATTDANVVREYELIGVPAVYLITPRGEIIDRHYGILTAEQLREQVEELLRVSG